MIYRGRSTVLDNGIRYLNVEEYLKSLRQDDSQKDQKDRRGIDHDGSKAKRSSND